LEYVRVAAILDSVSRKSANSLDLKKWSISGLGEDSGAQSGRARGRCEAGGRNAWIQAGCGLNIKGEAIKRTSKRSILCSPGRRISNGAAERGPRKRSDQEKLRINSRSDYIRTGRVGRGKGHTHRDLGDSEKA